MMHQALKISRAERASRICIHLKGMALVAALVVSLSAEAGDEVTDQDAREAKAAERAEIRWRHEGPASIPDAVHALCDVRSHTPMREKAHDWLLRLGPSAVPALISAAAGGSCHYEVGDILPSILCSDTGLTEQERARIVLTEIRALRRALADRRQAFVLAGLNALGNTVTANTPCPGRDPLLRALAGAAVATLDTADGSARRARLEALAALGSWAAPAVPLLIPLLDQPDLRQPAIELLAAIGPASEAAVPRLRRLVDESLDRNAIVALGRIKGPARLALPGLINQLRATARQHCTGKVPFETLAVAVVELAAGDAKAEQTTAAALREALGSCQQYQQVINWGLGRLSTVR